MIKLLSDKSGFSAIAYALIAAFAMTAIIGSIGLLVLSLGTGHAEFPQPVGIIRQIIGTARRPRATAAKHAHAA